MFDEILPATALYGSRSLMPLAAARDVMRSLAHPSHTFWCSFFQVCIRRRRRICGGGMTSLMYR